MPMERSEWLTEVDHILRKVYFIGIDDAGWSNEEIDRYFAYDMLPKDFVLWFGEKYDLSDFDTFVKFETLVSRV